MKKILLLGALALMATKTQATESEITHETWYGRYNMQDAVSTFGIGYISGVVPIAGQIFYAVNMGLTNGKSYLPNRLKEMAALTAGHACGVAVLCFAAKGIYHTLPALSGK